MPYDTISPGVPLAGSTAGQPAVTMPCCDGSAINHPEKVYQFTTPATGGVATVRVTGQTANTTPARPFFPSVYVTTAPNGSSIGCETSSSATSAELRVQLAPSTTYYIVVDGSAAMSAYGQPVTGSFLVELLYGATYGSALIRPSGAPIANVVKLRYRFAVAANDTAANSCTGQTWKIAFMPERFVGPGGVLTEFQGGAPQTNIYNSGRTFQNGAASHVCYPPSVPSFTDPGAAASMWFSAEDYNPSGRVGSKTQDPLFFPNFTQLVDGFLGEWKHEYVSQVNLNGRRGTVTVERIGTTTDTVGLSCNVPELMQGSRWIWRHTLDLRDGAPHSVDFMLPSATAAYLDPAAMTSVYSEAFYVHRGLMTVQFWGFEVQQEGSASWTPLSQWGLVASDAENSTPKLYNWGYRATSVAGHNAIELSNDPSATYVRIGQAVATAPNPTCRESACVSTGAGTCSLAGSMALSAGCELDLGDQDVTIPAGVTLTSSGGIAIVARKLTVAGTVRSTGGAGTSLILQSLSSRIEIGVGGLVENKGGGVLLSSQNGILHQGVIDVANGGVVVWSAGKGKDAAMLGTVYANGGSFTIGGAWGGPELCSIYTGGTAYAHQTSIAYAGDFVEGGGSGAGFVTDSATLRCRCSSPSCNKCVDEPSAGMFSNSSGPVTPAIVPSNFGVCPGGCS